MLAGYVPEHRAGRRSSFRSARHEGGGKTLELRQTRASSPCFETAGAGGCKGGSTPQPRSLNRRYRNRFATLRDARLAGRAWRPTRQRRVRPIAYRQKRSPSSHMPQRSPASLVPQFIAPVYRREERSSWRRPGQSSIRGARRSWADLHPSPRRAASHGHEGNWRSRPRRRRGSSGSLLRRPLR